MTNQPTAATTSECPDSRTGHKGGAYGCCRHCGYRLIAYVAKDPRSGLHLRAATAAEVEAYNAQPGPGEPGSFRREAFRKPVRVGEVLVDTDTGPGQWFGGAGF